MHKHLFRFLISIIVFSVLSLTLAHFKFDEWILVHEPIHSVVEALGGFAAVVLAIMFLIRNDIDEVVLRLFIASSFLAMGIMDGFHSLAHPGESFVWLHSIATFSGGFFFALIWLPDNLFKQKHIVPFSIGVTIFSVLLSLTSYVNVKYVPAMLQDGQFTPLAIALNLLGGLFFLLAAIKFVLIYDKDRNVDTRLFAALCILFGLASLLFQASELWNMEWWLWHILRLIAYLIVLFHLFEIFISNQNRVEKLNETLLENIEELEVLKDNLEESSKELRLLNKQLEKKIKELDEFTYVASHDLQEPLRKMISFSDILKMDLGGNLDEDSTENLNFVIDAAKRMQKLVQDLLAFSRSGRIDKSIKKQPLDICIDNALNSMELRILETGAVIKRDQFPEIEYDLAMLTQVYQNLIGNALKFSDNETPKISVTAELTNGNYVFGVKDNGIGIPQEYTNQIFAPFKRLHGRHEYEGTGIGLAICRKIIERHSGRIWVESEYGTGSHFKFTLNTELAVD